MKDVPTEPFSRTSNDSPLCLISPVVDPAKIETEYLRTIFPLIKDLKFGKSKYAREMRCVLLIIDFLKQLFVLFLYTRSQEFWLKLCLQHRVFSAKNKASLKFLSTINYLIKNVYFGVRSRAVQSVAVFYSGWAMKPNDSKNSH